MRHSLESARTAGTGRRATSAANRFTQHRLYTDEMPGSPANKGVLPRFARSTLVLHAQQCNVNSQESHVEEFIISSRALLRSPPPGTGATRPGSRRRGPRRRLSCRASRPGGSGTGRVRSTSPGLEHGVSPEGARSSWNTVRAPQHFFTALL